MGQLKSVHPLVLKLFPNQLIGNFPLARRLKYFLHQWRRITSNPEILSWLAGLKLEFLREPIQVKPPHKAKISKEESLLVNKEVEAMLEKGAIQKTEFREGQFLSNIFLVTKKQGGYRPVINLKNLNAYIPYLHFKMEGLHLLKDLLKENDWLCKIDLYTHLRESTFDFNGRVNSTNSYAFVLDWGQLQEFSQSY